MQHHGVAHITNSILKIDKVAAVLTMAAWAAGYRAGYVECATHVEEVLQRHFGTVIVLFLTRERKGCSEPKRIMITFLCPTEALKHDDFVPRLRSIFVPEETVQLTDDEDDADDDGAE
ncbi:hypothetical protein HanPI659440_Chr12g0470781 [Helianthus annuus]|nr:hypothetical protein HanPI659440_Chr12g0470781 [Helianthus annuus]